jgi:hypothetical protein
MQRRLLNFRNVRGRIGLTLNPSDPTYSAASIVGSTLIALTSVTAYDEPYDGSNIVGTYAPGQTVGVVTSWEDQDSSIGISVLNWQFMDSNGTPYYVPHAVGKFSIQALADQGVLTAGQQAQAAIDAANPKSLFQTEIEKYVPWIIGGVLGIFVLGTYLKDKK